MRTYAAISTWGRGVLDGAGLDKVRQHPGPDLPDEANACVVWTRYGGPGEDLEGVIDDISWQARVIGKQNDYTSAETVADVLDVALLSVHSSHIGGFWVTRIQRVGGAPNALLLDDADRTHFVCSYIIGTELALAN